MRAVDLMNNTAGGRFAAAYPDLGCPPPTRKPSDVAVPRAYFVRIYRA
jgi:hypothetical protein